MPRHDPGPGLSPRQVIQIQFEAPRHDVVPAPDAGIATTFRSEAIRDGKWLMVNGR